MRPPVSWLVTSAERSGMRLVSVVMGSHSAEAGLWQRIKDGVTLWFLR